MRGRFVAATAQIKVSHFLFAETAERVHAFGRKIDLSLVRGCCRKKYLLLCDELGEILIQFRIQLCHRYTLI